MGRWPECESVCKGGPEARCLQIVWMAESVSADHNKNGGGGHRERSQHEKGDTKTYPPNHPGSYKETDCLMGVLATSIEDRDCDTVT